MNRSSADRGVRGLDVTPPRGVDVGDKNLRDLGVRGVLGVFFRRFVLRGGVDGGCDDEGFSGVAGLLLPALSFSGISISV